MKFLFLCTGNSCRSILSEVLFNSRAPEGWKAYSAGSKPSGQVHPLTLETLENLGLSMTTVEHINRRLDALFKLNVDKLSRSELIAAINQISNVE